MTLGQTAALTSRMEEHPLHAQIRRKIARKLEEVGHSPAFERFLNKYGKDTTKMNLLHRACSLSQMAQGQRSEFNPGRTRPGQPVMCVRIGRDRRQDQVQAHRLAGRVRQHPSGGDGRAQNTRTVTAMIIPQS